MNIDLVCVEGVGDPMGAKALEYSYENFTHARKRILVSPERPSFFKGEFQKISKLSYEDYNRFCIWNLCSVSDADFILLVQSDGMVINQKFWYSSFLNYDYVGAPWNSATQRRLDGSNAVGNGGFSLRSRKFLDLCKNIESDLYEHCKKTQESGGNEDLFLCKYMYKYFVGNGIKFCPPEFAAVFSFEESVFNANPQRSFGFHGKASQIYIEMTKKLNNLYK
jgi:hypothetical protein